MPVNSVAEQVFGIIGTVCWTGQIIPQIWKSWREKTTEGLSHWLMLIWCIAGVFLGVFVIVQDLNIPLIVQPQVFGCLSLLSWSQCLYYGHRMPLRKVLSIFIATFVSLGGFEAGMVFAIRPAVHEGNQKPVTFFGIMTSILLAAGLLPQYWEIIRYREVKGISMFFITIDTLGGVFSLLSLVFRKKFDALAGVAYSLVIVLDGIVIILALILNPMAERRRRRQLAEESITDRESQAPLGATATVVPHTRESTMNNSVAVSKQESASRRRSQVRLEKFGDDSDGRQDCWNSISEKSHEGQESSHG